MRVVPQRSSPQPEAIQAALEKIYLNPNEPGSLGGLEALYRRAQQLKVPGLTRAAVARFLSGVSAYTLHKPARKRFLRRHVFTQGIDDQWQADLVDLGLELRRANKGYRYLLTCIDSFSKFAWAVPVREKTGTSMVAAFKGVFEQAKHRLPRRLQTDRGREFLNHPLQTLFKQLNIKHFASWSDQKASIVERFNRTLKAHMWRYFTARQTHRFLDVLDALLHAYNHSNHRAIGMSPASVRPSHEAQIAKRLYPRSMSSTSIGEHHSKSGSDGHARQPAASGGLPARAAAAAAAAAHRPAQNRSHPPPPPPALLSSDEQTVRVSRVKGAFEKGYLPNWSEEDFRVREAMAFTKPGPRERRGTRHHPLVRHQFLYKLEDRAGEPLHGTWNSQEIQPIRANRFLIEKVLRRRERAQVESKAKRVRSQSAVNERECLVKWKGWPAKFNTWIPESDIAELYSTKNIKKSTARATLHSAPQHLHGQR